MNKISFAVNKTNLYEQIANHLEQVILNPTIDIEPKLPSEQALAIQFSVSRTVIREALKLLKERGLIIQKNGDGSYITKPRTDTVSSAISRIIHMDKIDNDDLHGIRIILEVAAARLAALNAKPEEIEELKKIVDSMENRTLTFPERIKKDAEFHITLAKASRNELLTMFVETMTILLRDYMGKGVLLPGGIEDGLMRHRRIIAALETGSPDQAEEAIREHLKVSRQNVSRFDEENVEKSHLT
jgi:GntR family transcriptional regulator, transcriptional repressor for pyruvate dehydrogenase complex